MMICASCGETTTGDPCDVCKQPALLDARYQLTEVVGRGAMGVTYRATALADGSDVAVKEIAMRNAKNFKDWELGQREAEVLKQLEHRSIPRYKDHFVFGLGKSTGLFIVQEFIRGRTLHFEQQDHRYDEKEVLAILEEILGVLSYLHALVPPLIHRDLKPSNIMRRDDDRSLVLIDFGTVRDALKDPKLGGSTIAGTFGYMAPEQYEGKATPATDIYGLGALAVALLTREDPSGMMRYTGKLDWEGKLSFVSGSFRALLRSMLEPDPMRRASSSHEVLERVHRVQRGEVTLYQPSGLSPLPIYLPPQPARRSSNQRMTRAMAFFFVPAVIAIGIGIGSLQHRAHAKRTARVVRSTPGVSSYSPALPMSQIRHWCDLNFVPACVRYADILTEKGEKSEADRIYATSCEKLNRAACGHVAAEVGPPRVAPEPEGRTRLDDAELLAALRSHRDDIASCLAQQKTADPTLEGVMSVNMMIRPNGRTSRISVAPDKFKGSKIGACVIETARRWTFPPFDGSPTPINFPIRVHGE